MSRKCQVTGKATTVGRSYAIRGISKKKKGIGLNTTGITKRRFYPNLFTKRVYFAEENRFITLKLCASALRMIDKKGVAYIVHQLRKEGQTI